MNKKEEFKPDHNINITQDTCPITFVKTKLRLEKMEKGEILEVILNEGEPLKNVPLSCQELGHEILLSEPAQTQGTYRLWVRKA